MVFDSDGDRSGALNTVAFHPDGIHFFGGTMNGIRRWRIGDGQEVGKQVGMDMSAISVSRDGKWIVCGFFGGANVWDAELQEKVVEVEDTNYVEGVDVSPDSTMFATATARTSKNASIWSISTGERLIGPLLEHDSDVLEIKFSPDGRRVATACRHSIHIFDSYNGDQLITIDNPIPDWSAITPIVWPSAARLFAVSEGGRIKSFDTSSGSQLAEWQIHSHDSDDDLMSIALSTNNRFIASSANRSVSFWVTSTHTQLGSLLKDDDGIRSIALSPDGFHLATGGVSKTITIWNLSDILPESYLPITVSVTFPMLERPITFVYQSTFL